jgi:hypothetical protein
MLRINSKRILYNELGWVVEELERQGPRASKIRTLPSQDPCI